MIKKIVQGVMNTGINKYAAINQTDINNVQIQITDQHPAEPQLTYKIAVNWQPGQQVSFLEIMDKKMDILSYEHISSTFIKQSIHAIAAENSCAIEDISVFIYRYNNELAMAIYNKTQNIRALTLGKYLEELGLE